MNISVSPIPGACPYEPPDSLWGLIEKSTPPHEREEIKHMLGEDMVEQSLELHQEVALLLEIWRDYRDETEDLMTRSVQRLPEPPAARDRLKQEIKFFVESIREKSKEHGRDVNEAFSSTNTTVIQYALDERCASSGYGSRPSTARSSNGRETPMHSDRCRSSLLSTLSDEVDAINDKLTYLKFDQVQIHLRETLESEVVQLRADADFLQKCLDDEVDFRSQSREGAREPSLADLSVERSKLEKELLKPESPVPGPMRAERKPTLPKPNSIITPAMSQSRPAPPSAPKPGVSSVRRTPLKASHNIPVTRSNMAEPASKQTEHKHTHTRVTGSAKSSSRSPSHGLVQAPRDMTSRASSASSTRSVTPPSAQGSVKDHLPAPEGPYGALRMPDTSQHVIVRSRQHSQSKGTADGAVIGDYVNGDQSPPASASKQSRPSSASRFRRMVQQCRE